MLIKACVVASLSLEAGVSDFIPTLDFREKMDGFIQVKMKDDKQADVFAERRLSEFILETRVQNYLLILLDGRAAGLMTPTTARRSEHG